MRLRISTLALSHCVQRRTHWKKLHVKRFTKGASAKSPAPSQTNHTPNNATLAQQAIEISTTDRNFFNVATLPGLELGTFFLLCLLTWTLLCLCGTFFWFALFRTNNVFARHSHFSCFSFVDRTYLSLSLYPLAPLFSSLPYAQWSCCTNVNLIMT